MVRCWFGSFSAGVRAEHRLRLTAMRASLFGQLDRPSVQRQRQLYLDERSIVRTRM